MADQKKSFEKSLVRLEEIVAEMESGSLDLEKMISCSEEGQGLIKFCTDKLNEVDRKIEVLVKKGEDVVSEPMDGEEPGEEKPDAELF